MKNYYFILGINIYAREGEIKAAYRKLAFQYHPDVNPAPEAEAKFKEINEAYEVLSDTAARSAYDQLLTGVVSEPEVAPSPSRPHRDPRYRPKPPGTYKSRRKETLEMMERLLPYALNSSRITLLFVLILCADYLLPNTKSDRLVVDYNRFGKFNSSVIQTDNGKTLTIGLDKSYQFKKGTTIIIYSSPLLAVPRAVENEQSHYTLPIRVSIYGNFIFVPLVLLITSVLGVFYEKGVEFRFNLGVVNFLLLLLNFLFLQIHKF